MQKPSNSFGSGNPNSIDDEYSSVEEFDISDEAENVSDPLDIRSEHRADLQDACSELQVEQSELQTEHTDEPHDGDLQIIHNEELQAGHSELQDDGGELQIISVFQGSQKELQTEHTGELQASSRELQDSNSELQIIIEIPAEHSELQDSSKELQDKSGDFQIILDQRELQHSTNLLEYNGLIFDPTPINMEDVITCIPVDKLNDDYVVCFIPDEANNTQLEKTIVSYGTKSSTVQNKKPQSNKRKTKESSISLNKPFQCSSCKQSFKTQPSLDMHRSWCERVEEIETQQKRLKMQNDNVKVSMEGLKSTEEMTQNPCLKCKLDFGDRISLLHHIKVTHWLEVPCTFCDRIFTNGLALHNHIKTHLICFLCMVKYPNEESYFSHIADHKFGNVFKYECFSCDKSFRYFYDLETHNKLYHNYEKSTTTTFDRAKKSRKYLEFEPYFSDEQLEVMCMKQCEYCWKVVKPIEIMVHYKYYHYVRKCNVCNCFLPYDQEWLLVTQFNKDVTDICKYCGAKDVIDAEGCSILQKMIKKLVPSVCITRFECRYCFAYNFEKEQLLAHERKCDQRKEMVRKVKPTIPENTTKCLKCNQYEIDSDIHSSICDISDLELPCIVCTEKFSCLAMIEHLYFHSYCGSCEKPFTKLYNQHFLSHTLDKIHIGYCPICKYRFVGIAHHMQTRHSNAQLDWLELETRVLPTVSTAALERMVESNESIPCVFCFMLFNTMCTFELHLKYKHSILKCSQCSSFSFDLDCQECQKKTEICIELDD